MAEMDHLGSWDERHAFLRDQAAFDVDRGSDPRPCMVAFTGTAPVFVAWLRNFVKGGHDDAIIELLALACPLGADRVALSMPARAWSLDDPLPPVVDGVGDLRQRVLVVEEADGHTPPVTTRTTGYPFDVEGRRLRWLEPLADEGASSRVAFLLAAVLAGERMTGSEEEIRRQAERCTWLGHLLAFPHDTPLGQAQPPSLKPPPRHATPVPRRATAPAPRDRRRARPRQPGRMGH